MTGFDEIIHAFSHPTEQKIAQFGELKSRWHFAEGQEIAKEAVADALLLHSCILSGGFTKTDAFPGLNGELQITVYYKDEYFEFTREKNGTWSFVEEDLEDEIESKSDLDFSTVISIVHRIQQRLCNIYAYYPLPIGTKRGRGSHLLLLNRQQMAESRSLRNPVSKPLPTPPAHTLEISTRTLPRNHQSSGNFPVTIYRSTPNLFFLQEAPAEMMDVILTS